MLLRLCILLLASLIALSACTGASPRPTQSFEFAVESSAARHFSAWLADDAQAFAIEANYPSPEQRFVALEVAYWDGDVERAWELAVAMLRENPGHRLNRVAAVRLHDLQNEVVDYYTRTASALQGVRYAGEDPVTRMYLALVGQVVALEHWSNSESDAPFSADELGVARNWRMTPSMSPWRLLDFATAFAPEQQDKLDERYLSPQIAVDDAANRKRTRPYAAANTTLSPDLGSAGIYYMESFVTVEENDFDGQNYWLYGNFPSAAAVWIDGQEVFRREEDGYGTNKRFRHINLSAGTHRILVKLAYQPGYRDWFDLFFMNDQGGPLGGQQMAFSMHAPEMGAKGSVKFLSEVQLPSQLESVMVSPKDTASASDVALYLTASAAHQNGQPEYFDPAWSELVKRHEGFAPAYALKSAQVQTLWELPGELRDATALSFLRHAYELRGDSLHTLVRLGRWLRQRGNDREVRELLEAARERARDDQGRLKNVEPLFAWAYYLDSRGWNESAELAWQSVLKAAPSHCLAATSLQTLYYNRSYYPELAQITAGHRACPSLAQRENSERPDRVNGQLELARREASRHPLRTDRQLRYVRQLVLNDQADQAKAVLEAALERLPGAVDLWSELANLELVREGKAASAQVLRKAMQENGHSGWLVWRTATLEAEIPLRDMMADGYAAAMADVAATRRAGKPVVEPEAGVETSTTRQSSDEAYYVVDFAARQYYPDGAAITLTHTVVRVMTRGAIDRYGETDIPNNARLLLARTIKQDGSVRVPEEVAGKAALSMPSLAEGDLVEIAYLQFSSASEIASHIEDIRFYFRMQDISTIHSEYVLLGVDDAKFMVKNGAPTPEPFAHKGVKGTRFIANDNPRPRAEAHSVHAFEHLPWIQGYRAGITGDVFDAERRYIADLVQDNTRPSTQLVAQVTQWLGRAPGGSYSAEDVQRLFYGVSQWITEPSPNALGTEASHVLVARRGSPMILLKAALDIAQIPAEIYLVKSKMQIEQEYPIGEFAKYSKGVLKVALAGGEAVWLDPSGPDAMYAALDAESTGQPAVCLSCTELVRETVIDAPQHRPSRHLDVTAALGDDGTLTGVATYTFTGTRAANVRASLRGRTDETSRQKYFEAVLNDTFAGSTLVEAVVDAEREPDQPLIMRLEFARTQFARPTARGGLQLESNIFREALASIYAQLPNRTLGLMVGYEREHTYALKLTFPSERTARLTSRAGAWNHDSGFGSFERSVKLNANVLEIQSSIRVPIQRVAAADYGDFQKWATAVEQSSMLFVQLD
ncbi:MAG: hypothetical protein H0U74_14795 [Bradymonadaceae bacterium]|nr:hypothetical protein [Lujinxingiaceae bacterium]